MSVAQIFPARKPLQLVHRVCKTLRMSMGNPVGGGIPEFDFGDRLNKALEYAGMSHQEMADYLGVSRNTIGNYIAERNPIKDGYLRLWSMRTRVKLVWLQTGQGPSTPSGPEGPDGPDGSPATGGRGSLGVDTPQYLHRQAA